MDSAADPFDLKRFVDAQEPVYADVVDELRAGRKRRHWMWFVFPQLRGLGGSAMADRYGISSLPEAAPTCATSCSGRVCTNAPDWSSGCRADPSGRSSARPTT